LERILAGISDLGPLASRNLRSSCRGRTSLIYRKPSTIPVTAPYPVAQNFSLIWTGLTQSITVATNPAGLNIAVDGVAAIAPQTYTWIPGNEHAISTTTPQAVPGGGSAPFVNWSDNGQLTHIIVVPNAPETITATFDAAAPVITPQVSCAPQLFDAVVNPSATKPVANQYVMIGQC
jgi:hypothetical protein